MIQGMGKFLMVSGAVLLVVGILVYFGGSRLNWFGKLPGDIWVEKENFSFYFPITTMILVSVILSLVVYLVNKFRG